MINNGDSKNPDSLFQESCGGGNLVFMTGVRYPDVTGPVALGTNNCSSPWTFHSVSLKNSNEVTTKASCKYSRPFVFEGMTPLKITDTITYTAGFNFWADSDSTIIIASDTST